MTRLFIFVFLFFVNNLFAQELYINYDKAIQEASSNKKNIVLLFQGSDWCAPCIKLDKEIWSTEEFQKLSKNHFIMLKANFPRKKANKLSEKLTSQNAKLAETYNSQGFFPLVVVLDKNGKTLGKMGYEKISPTKYFNKLKMF